MFSQRLMQVISWPLCLENYHYIMSACKRITKTVFGQCGDSSENEGGSEAGERFNHREWANHRGRSFWMANTANHSMREDEESESKGWGDGTSKGQTTKREGKEIAVALLSFPLFLTFTDPTWTSLVPLWILTQTTYRYIYDNIQYFVAGCRIICTCHISSGHSLQGYHLKGQIRTKIPLLSFEYAKSTKGVEHCFDSNNKQHLKVVCHTFALHNLIMHLRYILYRMLS